MRITRASLAVLLSLTLFPTSVRAQEGRRFRFVPQVGWVLPQRELGAVAPAGAVRYLELGKTDPTPALGAAVEVPGPISALGLRVSGVALLPAGASGFFDCYPGLACPAVLLEGDADVWALAATADLLFSPFRGRGVRPTVIAGYGLRRYAYDWAAPPVLVQAGSHRETTHAVRAGLGLSADLLGGSFRLEAVDLWSPRGDRIRPAGPSGQLSAPGRRSQHDLLLSLGWVLLRF